MDYIIKNTSIVNEGKIVHGDVIIKNGRIDKITSTGETKYAAREIDGSGKYLLPGAIEDRKSVV